jgi:hypothetical protein
MARKEDAELKDEYEAIARRALQDAEDSMRTSRNLREPSVTERYRQQALAWVEIAKAATGLLVAVDDTKETAARALLSRLNNTPEDKHA